MRKKDKKLKKCLLKINDEEIVFVAEEIHKRMCKILWKNNRSRENKHNKG